MFPLRDDNPTLFPAVVTIAIVAANALVWALVQGFGGDVQLGKSICEFGMIPGELSGLAREGLRVPLGPSMSCVIHYASTSWLTPLTSMFLHGGWFHILGNMWFLWVFGDNVEDAMGGLRFALFYLLCGLAAAAAQALANPASAIPMVGASGAIGGVMGAYAVLYPRANVNMFVTLGFYITRIDVPAFVVLGYWFLLQIIGGIPALASEGGGVAFWAHTGGFLAGILLCFVLRDPARVARHKRVAAARGLVLSLCLLALMSAPAAAEEMRESHRLMGSVLEVTVDAPSHEQGQDLIRDAVAVAERLERQFSDSDDGSDLLRLNQHAGQGAAPVPVDLYRVLLLSRLLTRASGGAFDVSVGPLLQLRRSAAAAGRAPLDEEVDAAFALVGADKIALVPAASVELPRRGMALDLGGIGRGYVLERMAAFLRAAGVEKALLSFGGNLVVAVGPPQDEDPWLLWVPHGTSMAGSITLRNRAMATARSLRRDDESGEASPHIVDPRSGRWIEADRQATVVAIDAAIAEAWSNALVVDPEGGLDSLVEPRDVEAVVFDERGESRTPRFEDFASWKPARRGGQAIDDKVDTRGDGATSGEAGDDER